MRSVALGSWTYYLWHLPACALLGIVLLVAFGAARSVALDTLSPPGLRLRWNIVGASALLASLLCAIAWPYATAVARVEVSADGAWRLRNYLGLPLGTVRPEEARSLLGRDLGGVGFGAGSLEVHTRRGVLRSVRIDRLTLDRALRALGYREGDARDRYGDRVLEAHTFAAGGPRFEGL